MSNCGATGCVMEQRGLGRRHEGQAGRGWWLHDHDGLGSGGTKHEGRGESEGMGEGWDGGRNHEGRGRGRGRGRGKGKGKGRRGRRHNNLGLGVIVKDLSLSPHQRRQHQNIHAPHHLKDTHQITHTPCSRVQHEATAQHTRTTTAHLDGVFSLLRLRQVWLLTTSLCSSSTVPPPDWPRAAHTSPRYWTPVGTADHLTTLQLSCPAWPGLASTTAWRAPKSDTSCPRIYRWMPSAVTC
ncbi:hypothetical protein E2C01_017280 [Portunus trituberculatus]|uniref:Uncharacterized protein n=1 Tax=Portunus trituberculatus TaxID=210409 RepID=A0A5B7DSZ0_PORTR|nr:hypothetical protein [Portunus trituberculatus]